MNHMTNICVISVIAFYPYLHLSFFFFFEFEVFCSQAFFWSSVQLVGSSYATQQATLLGML